MSLVIDIRRIIQILCIIALKVTAIDVQFFQASFLLISIQTYSLLILKAIFYNYFFYLRKKFLRMEPIIEVNSLDFTQENLDDYI